MQGNILAAFNKDHQVFRLVTLPADPVAARAWLGEVLPLIAVTADVEDWNQQFSAKRKTLPSGQDPDDMHTWWVGLSLTSAGITQLAIDPAQTTADLSAVSASLTAGPAARAQQLGDVGPSDPAHWVFGAPGQPVIHAILTVAADRDTEDLQPKLLELDALDLRHGAVATFAQVGATLPGDSRGHEHFGFKDGISQPGVIGFHASGLDGDRDGHPGTKMVPAGTFVFGQPDAPPVPAWLNDGSVHVLRRLNQDVAAWNAQLAALAQLTSPPCAPQDLGALLMGRQPDGTPLAAPNTHTGVDQNNFDYLDDADGQRTPCAAHIRKTHPRGIFPMPRLARRGIPFGPPFETAPAEPRGLVFNCFVTSLENQFEFIQQSWVNNAGFSAGGGPTGPDPVIGAPGQVTISTSSGTTGTLTVAQTVTTTGAVYAVALSLPTLALLGAGQALPR